MRLIFLCFFSPVMLIMASCSSPQSPSLKLKEAIRTELSHQKGRFAVAFKDLSTGDTIFLNEHESFHAASTMKTPVMVELFAQAAAGNFKLTDSLVLRNEFRSIVDSSVFNLNPADDSETDLYKHLGEKRTIQDLIYLMITKSSNLATNMLIERVGAKAVTDGVRHMGAKDLVVLRGVEDNKAFQKGMNNTVTAYDLMLIFEKMASGQTVNPKASEEMIRILLDQTFKEIIPAQLPVGVKVAHKTGWFKSVNHDSGIIFLPDGRKYVLVLLSKNVEKDEDAIRALANISGKIYQYMMEKSAPVK